MFDRARGRVFLFGGYTRTWTDETWEFSSPCALVGPGHPGGGLRLGVNGPPGIGRNLCLRLLSARGANLLFLAQGPCRLPTSIGPPLLCASGSLFLRPEIVLLRQAPGVFCIGVPRTRAFVGRSLCVQGLAADSRGCWTASDAWVLTVQGR